MSHMRKLIIFNLLFFCAITIFAQEKKVALIIGNGNYSEFFKELRTPVNDAKAMDWSLKELGFTTILGTDRNRTQMSDLIEQFKKEAKGADIALFFYSGHGGYTDKQKYFLVPSGVYKNSSTLAGDCYDFEAVEKTMVATGARLKLFYIDACRSSLDGSKGWVSFDPGKIVNKKDEAKGTALYFGTTETTPAFEGGGNFSIFTQALLNHIDDSGYFGSVWDNISREVVSQNANQTPTKITSRDFRDFKLNPMGYRLGKRVRDGFETINISAYPTHAKIKIGKETYSNNTNIDFPFGYKYDIEITADGYEPCKKTISVYPTPNSQKKYEYHLSKLEPATLYVSSNKSNAMVYIDGKYAGYTNRTLNVLSGTHQIKVVKRGYYDKTITKNLSNGRNSETINLERDYPCFFETVDAYDDSGILTYHYSPKNQIGLSYLHRLSSTDGKLSVGAMLASSVGLFSQLGAQTDQAPNLYLDLDLGGNQDNTEIETHKEYINLTDLEYSDYVDPYHEAKHYDINALMLGKVGYSPCNGVTLDLGIGAAYHQDKYWMKEPYAIKKTYTTNKLTGETSEPSYEYVHSGQSTMYKDKSKWSLALRLGSIFFIPINDNTSIVLGGGYTYLPMNNKCSSWDACLGISWEF